MSDYSLKTPGPALRIVDALIASLTGAELTYITADQLSILRAALAPSPETPGIARLLTQDVADWRRDNPDLPWVPKTEHLAALAPSPETPGLAALREAFTAGMLFGLDGTMTGEDEAFDNFIAAGESIGT